MYCVWFCCDLPKQVNTHKNTCQLMFKLYMLSFSDRKNITLIVHVIKFVIPEPVGIIELFPWFPLKQNIIIQPFCHPSYPFHPSEKLEEGAKMEKMCVIETNHKPLKERPVTVTHTGCSHPLSLESSPRTIRKKINIIVKSNRKAMNRNWSNPKANPALKTKAGNNNYYK